MDTDDLRRTIEAWDGESVVVAHDRETGTWIFIALHDTRLGHAVGGTRLKTYPSLDDALLDAMRLAEGMTYKWAGIRIPFGGGKAVLATPGPLAPEARRGLLVRYGRRLGSLNGAFRTGVDLGTTPEDMALVGAQAPYVMGVVHGDSRDPGPYTALGVFAGMRAALAARFGKREVAGRSVLIQGVGDVGLPLAELVSEAGGRLLLSDIDPEVAEAAAERLGGEVIDPAAIWDAEVDVYAPCAIGATLNADTIPRLRCAVVAGSANNQLAESADAERLHARGILYAPDYIVNAGGAIAFGRMTLGAADEGSLRAEVEGIEETLTELFHEAAEAGESPLHAAITRAERFLAGAGDAAA